MPFVLGTPDGDDQATHLGAVVVSESIAQMVGKIQAVQRGELPAGVVDPVRG